MKNTFKVVEFMTCLYERLDQDLLVFSKSKTNRMIYCSRFLLSALWWEKHV